eukprot:2664544-Rhodomonas_salina.2
MTDEFAGVLGSISRLGVLFPNVQGSEAYNGELPIRRVSRNHQTFVSLVEMFATGVEKVKANWVNVTEIAINHMKPFQEFQELFAKCGDWCTPNSFFYWNRQDL